MIGPEGIGGSGPGSRMGILDSLKAGRIQGDGARLRAASDALEGSFYQELFKAMRETVPESGLLDGGGGEDAFHSLMDEHLAEAAAARSEGGIGQALYRWFSRGQEGVR